LQSSALPIPFVVSLSNHPSAEEPPDGIGAQGERVMPTANHQTMWSDWARLGRLPEL